jgi:hypothetical protein
MWVSWWYDSRESQVMKMGDLQRYNCYIKFCENLWVVSKTNTDMISPAINHWALQSHLLWIILSHSITFGPQRTEHYSAAVSVTFILYFKCWKEWQDSVNTSKYTMPLFPKIFPGHHAWSFFPKLLLHYLCMWCRIIKNLNILTENYKKTNVINCNMTWGIKKINTFLRFEVLMAVMRNTIIWDMMCSLTKMYHFGGTYMAPYPRRLSSS